ncbi:MAG TPA: N-acyl homoserine lactonase family protein [Allosphingosinicella sp.]|jgi:glyoxylase-like metal-dependent hydrolase (beta-lactamase superfamily II)
MKKIAAAAAILLGLLAAPPAAAQPAQAAQPQRAAQRAPLSLWRLDCGEFTINQYGAFFSDTFQYPPGPKRVVGSCYLIRHADHYMLWDTGLTDALIGRPFSSAAQSLRLERSIVDQLRQIGVRPEQVEVIGISHWHFDHVGQAGRFPQARLLIGQGDLDLLRATPPVDEDSARGLAHWLTGGGRVEPVTRDHDVFGDGSVVMLTLPGHTPGHYALLVRLASGPVLLSGDTYHFTEQVANRGVPPFNHNRADSLASMDRFDRIARNLGARIIIQHEPADVAKLPAFPQAAH